jgi:hypothetical protein
MENPLRIEHEGKSYELKPGRITPELIDKVRVLKSNSRNIDMKDAQAELAKDPEAVALVDLTAMRMRDGVTVEQLASVLQKHPKVIAALNQPGGQFSTDASGRSTMAEIIQMTVDRTGFPDSLKAGLDSPYGKMSVEKVGDEHAFKTDEMSEFWQQFDVITMLDYCEFFCQRARI